MRFNRTFHFRACRISSGARQRHRSLLSPRHHQPCAHAGLVKACCLACDTGGDSKSPTPALGMRARSCFRRRWTGCGAQHLPFALPRQRPMNSSASIAAAALTRDATESKIGNRPSSASSTCGDLTSSGFGQFLGETLDAHRHRLDLTGQRGVLGARDRCWNAGPRSRIGAGQPLARRPGTPDHQAQGTGRGLQAVQISPRH